MFKKKYLKKIPLIKRLYPSVVKKILNFFQRSKIYYSFYGLKIEGDINEPMDKEIFLFNDYENNQIEYLIKKMKKKKFDYLVDVGANSGIYSLIIGKKYKNIRVISFEPVLLSTNKFIKNLKLNSNLKNIKIFNFGLSDKNSSLLMKSQKKKNYIQTGGFGVVKKNENLKNLHTQKAIFKIGDEILKLKKKKIVLKIDTEGHEEFVIKGLNKLLSNNQILLQIEIFDKNFSKIDNILNKKKFQKLNSISSDGKTDYYYINY